MGGRLTEADVACDVVYNGGLLVGCTFDPSHTNVGGGNGKVAVGGGYAICEPSLPSKAGRCDDRQSVGVFDMSLFWLLMFLACFVASPASGFGGCQS